MDSKGEFVLTLMAGFAQEEARSLSENTAWGIRRRMESGKYWVAYTSFIGYGPGFEIEDDGAAILTNEKYVGDVILYKTFSPNFPEKKRIPNNGEHKKYIQEDHHPAIISREMFRAVQEMRESRSNIERHADGTVTRKAKRYTGKKE